MRWRCRWVLGRSVFFFSFCFGVWEACGFRVGDFFFFFFFFFSLGFSVWVSVNGWYSDSVFEENEWEVEWRINIHIIAIAASNVKMLDCTRLSTYPLLHSRIYHEVFKAKEVSELHSSYSPPTAYSPSRQHHPQPYPSPPPTTPPHPQPSHPQ